MRGQRSLRGLCQPLAALGRSSLQQPLLLQPELDGGPLAGGHEVRSLWRQQQQGPPGKS